MSELRKWSWAEFAIGWINKKFLVFLVITYLVNEHIVNGLSEELKKILVIGWMVISVIWMLSGALEKLIENGKLDVEAKLGASISKS